MQRFGRRARFGYLGGPDPKLRPARADDADMGHSHEGGGGGGGHGKNLGKSCVGLTCYAVSGAALGLLALLTGGPKAAAAMTPVAQSVGAYAPSALGPWGMVLAMLAIAGVAFAIGGAMISGKKRDKRCAIALLVLVVGLAGWWWYAGQPVLV